MASTPLISDSLAALVGGPSTTGLAENTIKGTQQLISPSLAALVAPKEVTAGVPSEVEDPDSFGNVFMRNLNSSQQSWGEGVGVLAKTLGIPQLEEWSKTYAADQENDIREYGVPKRTSSIMEGFGEVSKAYDDKGLGEAIYRSALLAKDMSAAALGGAAIPVAAGLAAVPVARALGAAGPILLLAAPFIASFPMGVGQVYDEAIKLGADDKAAQGYAIGAGAVIGALDRYSAGSMIKSLVQTAGKDAVIKSFEVELGREQAKNIVEKALAYTGTAVKNVATKGTVPALTEAGSEALQEFVQAYAAGKAADKDLSDFDVVALRNRIIDAAALGFVGGKVIGTVSETLGAKGERDLAARAKELEEVQRTLSPLVADPENDITAAYSRETGLTRDETLKTSRERLSGIFRRATTFLNPLANRDERGAEIQDMFMTYPDEINANIGKDSEEVAVFFEDLKRKIKLPFQKAVPKDTQERLYNVLTNGTLDTDQRINDAAFAIRPFLGEVEVDPTTNKPLKPIKLGAKELSIFVEKGIIPPSLEEALARGKITQEQYNAFEAQIDPLHEEYKARAAASPSETSPILNSIVNSEQFASVNGTEIYQPQTTGLYKKLTDAGIDINFESGYLPRRYKTGFLNRRKMEAVLAKKLGKQAAAEIVDNIESNDGFYNNENTNFNVILNQGRKATATEVAFEKSREFTPEIVKELDNAGLIDKNTEALLYKYVVDSNKRLKAKEMANILNAKVNSLIKDDKISTEEINHIKDIYNATQHKLNPISDKRLQGIQKYLLTGTYILTLPLAGLTSLTEPLIILSRLSPKYALFGALKAANNALRAGLRTVFPKIPLNEAEKAFRGILQGLDTVISERLGDIAGVTASKKISDVFFKTTLLTLVTQISRDMAFQAARVQMKDDLKTVRIAEGTDGKKTRGYLDARKRLLEQGIVNPMGVNVQDWAMGKTATDPQIIRKAMSKTVDEFIMSPNAVNRPLWMNNPWLASVTQLKGFAATFGNVIGGRMWREIFVPLTKGRIPAGEAARYALTFSLLVFATMFIQSLKDRIRYGDEESPTSKLDGRQQMFEALMNTNIFGLGTVGYSAMNAKRYGGDALSAIFGPLPARFARIVEASGSYVMNNKPRQLAREITNLIPVLSMIPQVKDIKGSTTDSIEESLKSARDKIF